MANLVQGIANGVFQSVLGIVQAFFNIVYSFVYGILSLVWGFLESIAELVGASVHFVASNILILGLITLGFVLYRDRNKRGTMGNEMKKKAR
ncbi:MAG: hypothetical protein TREMPRED_003461 [Tremellales sp. Tagirdzhanova-0007]|nr:MAG: hypothetical protein TREMPRED_003461 [Tremellales sp. Tagirdzhanova-0007]